MINILKHGNKKKFTVTCPDCGCEFEYETEDLKADYSLCLTSYPGQYRRYIVCPECGKMIYHDSILEPYPTYPNVIYTTNTNEELDCDKYSNKPYCGDLFDEDYKGGEYKKSE